MKIVVDTNIVFSALLNSNSLIGDVLFNSSDRFEFYSCNYMRFEIQKHWQKLLKISRLTDQQLQVSYMQVISKIKFISEELIPSEIWIESEKITQDIDPNDVDFVALSTFLAATLWTGDKPLYHGLKKYGFEKVVNTAELLLLLE